MLILESLCVSLPSIAIRWDYFRGVRLQTNTIKHHKKKDSVFKLSENGSIKCQSAQWTFYWINYNQKSFHTLQKRLPLCLIKRANSMYNNMMKNN